MSFIDFPSMLYNPIYVSIGVPATITLDDSAGATADVTVIDHTAGIAIDERGGVGLQTIKPVAFVRAAELISNEITYDAGTLEDALIAFNGNTWRIESHQPKPSPGGEAAGEIMLILVQENTP